jgi:hypothetical protein
MTTPVAAKAPAAAPAKQAASVPPWPFPVGVFDEEIQNSYDQTLAVLLATKPFPDVEVEPEGWLRGLWFDFDITAVAGTLTAVAADQPFSAVNTVLLKGTNVPQTFGPFGGYDWMNVNKYGAYQPVGDPRNDQTFVALTTSTTVAHFTLYMPFEVSAHDGLGDLQNQSDNSVYRIAVTADAATTLATGATGYSIELKVEQDSYSTPVSALALSGRPVMNAPPQPGTRQCWQQEDDSAIPAGSHTTKITNGIGYAYRNIVLKLMRAGTSRANGESDFPDPLEVWLGGTRIKRLGQHVWKNKMGRRYSFNSTTADSKNGPENGVRVISYTQDVGMDPGNEARRKYLRTQDGNVFKLVGTYGNAGSLFITSNYVIPRGGPSNNSSIVA